MVPARRSQTRFSASGVLLRGLDPEDIGLLLSSTADVALVVDSAGVILDAAFLDSDLAGWAGADWIGQRLDRHGHRRNPAQSRGAHSGFPPRRSTTRWRQVNHPAAGGRRCPYPLPCGPIRRGWPDPRGRTRLEADGRSPTAARRGPAGHGARIHTDSQCRETVSAAVSTRLGGRPDFEFEHGAGHRGQSCGGGAVWRGAKEANWSRIRGLFADASRQAMRSFLAATRIAPRVDKVHAAARDGRRQLS